MPTPKNPLSPQQAPSPRQPLTLPPGISPHIREFFDKMLVVAKDHRTTQLVDYLCDLREEMLWVADELVALDFDAYDFLIGLDEQDDKGDDRSDDDDADDGDAPGPESVH